MQNEMFFHSFKIGVGLSWLYRHLLIKIFTSLIPKPIILTYIFFFFLDE